MSLAFRHLFANSSSQLTALHFTTSNKNPKVYAFPITSCHVARPSSSSSSFTFYSKPLHRNMLDFALHAYKSNDDVIQLHRNSDTGFEFDDFLSVAELLCNFSSAVILIFYAVNCTVLGLKNTVMGVLGSNRGFALGLVVMTCGIMIGSWIRRRQWRRICRETSKGRESVNLVERIEKLEDDLRSSATIIRVLSRQLEKLGTRFRVTRKTLKDPIAEIAALAQKNSEATRALAVQEDILEKELGEIQKVLLAMQDQQQKQLELILAIGKSGKLFEMKREANQEQDLTRTSDLTEGAKELETQET